ncbi:MAG: helix-hairpin-helix domain-containing protein [Candidatus Saccharibacteria bacterium]
MQALVISRDGVARLVGAAIARHQLPATVYRRLVRQYSKPEALTALLDMLYSDVERTVTIYSYGLYGEKLEAAVIGERFDLRVTAIHETKQDVIDQLGYYFTGKVCIYTWTSDPQLRSLGLPKKMIRYLLRAGIRSADDLLARSTPELSQIHGLGRLYLQQLLEAMAQQGMYPRPLN